MHTIEKDVYVAYKGDSSAYIAMDEYSILQISTGFLIESNNSVFGTNGFNQKAELRTDFKWQMQELRVIVDSLGIEMNVSVKNRKVYIQQKQHDTSFEKTIDLQYDKYFFHYNGALVIPMMLLRGYNFDNYEKVTYQMLPMGYAEIKQIPEPINSQEMRNFSINIYIQNFVDMVKVQTDKFGKVLFYHSETSLLTIKQQFSKLL